MPTTREMLTDELEHEARTTRAHLVRLPDDRLDWQPHPKSFSAGALASHFVDCLRWTPSIFGADELALDPATYRPYLAASKVDLLDTFDADVAAAARALAASSDDAVMQPWRLTMMGRVRIERPRAAAFRDLTLSHLIHHRGQFSVYLRLLGVAVPGSYGPSADEAF